MLVVHVITSLGQGGAEGVLYRLVSDSASQLNDIKHIVVSLHSEGYYGCRLQEANIEVHALNMPRGRLTISGLTQLYKLFRSKRPDIVQTWMYHADLIGGVVAKLAGVRFIFWGIRNSDLDPRRSSMSARLSARLCAWLSPLVPQAIISCSEYAARLHQALGYRKDKFHVIQNGYDISRFRPDDRERIAMRRELNIVSERLVIGSVGRWHPQKDYETLLSAVHKISRIYPEIKCVLVGRDLDCDNEELVDMVKRHSLENSIILAGPTDKVPSVMNAFDLYVSSSSCGEAFPNVVCEAMSCGTPCVVTDVGDSALIVGSTGWVVRQSDPVALANVLQTALAKIEAGGGEKLGLACRNRIKDNFSLGRMVSSYITLWLSCTTQEKEQCVES